MNSCGMIDETPSVSDAPHNTHTFPAKPMVTADTAATDIPSTTIRRTGTMSANGTTNSSPKA